MVLESQEEVVTIDWDNIFLREISLRYRELDEVRERAARAHDRCAAADAILNAGGDQSQLRILHESRWVQWFQHVEKERYKYLVSKYAALLWQDNEYGCFIAVWIPLVWPISAALLGFTDLECISVQLRRFRCVRCQYPIDKMRCLDACPECGLPWPLLPPTPATTTPL